MAGRVVGKMIPAQVLGRPLGGPVTETSRQACLACHSKVNTVAAAGAGGIRINHATCAADASCDSCHSTTGHGSLTRWSREPDMEKCTACHAVQSASLACTTCHVGKKGLGQQLATGPWQVTHGPNWEHMHGMGQLESCATCHPSDYCVRCHKVVIPHGATFGTEHGKLAIADRSSCLVCHKTETFCDACHGIQMPHPVGFLKSHSTAAKTIGLKVCQRCHSQQTCDACHVAHVHPGIFAVSTGTVPPSPKTGSP